MDKKIKAVVFDMDGTLVDTETVASKAITEVCASWGVNVQPKDAAEVAGKKWEVAFDLIYSRYQFPVAKEEAGKIIIEHFRKKTAENLPTIPGAAEAVKLFASRGPIALVSGSHRREIFFALDKLGVRDLFSEILGAEDYAQSKPSPDGYLKCFKNLGVTGKEVLIFEDSLPGIQSAVSSGAIVAAITSTNYFGHDQSAAHLRIKNLLEVTPAWIKNVEQKFF